MEFKSVLVFDRLNFSMTKRITCHYELVINCPAIDRKLPERVIFCLRERKTVDRIWCRHVCRERGKYINKGG
jgi:hypothetical protein